MCSNEEYAEPLRIHQSCRCCINPFSVCQSLSVDFLQISCFHSIIKVEKIYRGGFLSRGDTLLPEEKICGRNGSHKAQNDGLVVAAKFKHEATILFTAEFVVYLIISLCGYYEKISRLFLGKHNDSKNTHKD